MVGDKESLLERKSKKQLLVYSIQRIESVDILDKTWFSWCIIHCISLWVDGKATHPQVVQESTLACYMTMLKTIAYIVILFLDGHTSLSIEITRLGRKSEGILFSLPSHTTHALQPLDVGVYKWAIEEQLGPNYKTIQDGACATTVENSLLY